MQRSDASGAGRRLGASFRAARARLRRLRAVAGCAAAIAACLAAAAAFATAGAQAPSGATTASATTAGATPPAATSSPVPVRDAFVPWASGTRIVPTPQQETDLERGFTLTARTAVVLSADTPALRQAAAELASDVATRYGLRLSVLGIGEAPPPGTPVISVGTLAHPAPAGAGAFAALRAAGDAPQPVRRAEGYVLAVAPSGISIEGADEHGAFYGLESLRELLGDTPTVRGVIVRDWPAIRRRVAMVYLDASSDTVNQRLLPILAELKFNAILIVSDYLRWPSAPQLWVPQGATVQAAERLAATARSHLLEPIPLLETLSHAQWFFANGANHGLEGDPGAARPFVYDPLNPQVYQRLFPMLDELVRIFHPRIVHIGHDEVGHVNLFPATPAQKAVGFGRLFLDDVLRIHDHLAAEGVRTMIWGDDLLSPALRPLWPQFPRDLVVAAWNYQAAGAYPQLQLAREAGFPVMGTAWSDRDNIVAMARAVARAGADGFIETRWTGYFGNATMLRSAYPQVYAYVTAGAASWNPAASPPRAAPAWFRQAWLAGTGGGPRAGALIDLATVGDQPLGRGFLGLGDGYALSGLLDPTLRFAGVRYRIDSAVAVRGQAPRARGLPQRVRIPIGRAASELAFLQATGWAAPAKGDVVGRYEVVYADGTRQTVPLEYDVNIASWTQTTVGSIDLDQPWQGTTPNGLPVAVYQLVWHNPEPDVPIDHVTLVTAGGIANPVLFGLTLIDQGASTPAAAQRDAAPGQPRP